MGDTNIEIEAKVRAMIGKRSGSERFLMGCSMYDVAKTLVVSSLYEKSPRLAPSQLRYEIFLRFYMGEYNSRQIEKIKEYFV